MLKTIALLAFSSFALAAHGAQQSHYECFGAGACVCFESMSPKGVIGYETKPSVTCINMRTMERRFYDDVGASDVSGTYVGQEPKH